MSDVDEVTAMILSDSTEVLEAKLQRLHRSKLSANCLLNPSYRDKVDQLVSMIGKELKERREPHEHKFKLGGQCEKEGCQKWCPHPFFKQNGALTVCLDCGCLQPWQGSPDFYEIPLGQPQNS